MSKEELTIEDVATALGINASDLIDSARQADQYTTAENAEIEGELVSMDVKFGVLVDAFAAMSGMVGERAAQVGFVSWAERQSRDSLMSFLLARVVNEARQR